MSSPRTAGFSSTDRQWVTIDGRSYRVSHGALGGHETYGIEDEKGDLQATLARVASAGGQAWTIATRRPTFDARTAEAVLEAAVAKKLVGGHTVRVPGVLIAVAGENATIGLFSGAEVSLPWPNPVTELETREAFRVGWKNVFVEFLDGVPTAFELCARTGSSTRLIAQK